MVNVGSRHSGCERQGNFSQHVFIQHFHCQLFEMHLLPFGNVNIVILMCWVVFFPDTKSKQILSMLFRFI